MVFTAKQTAQKLLHNSIYNGYVYCPMPLTAHGQILFRGEFALKRKTLSFLLSLLLVSTFIAGCSGDTPASSSENSSEDVSLAESAVSLEASSETETEESSEAASAASSSKAASSSASSRAPSSTAQPSTNPAQKYQFPITTMALSGNQSPYVPAGYKLVWNDEFNGNTLSHTRWTPIESMGAQDVVMSMDSDNVFVKDGMLNLTAKQETKYQGAGYSTCYGISTYNTVNLAYGYIEFRAKFPFKHGAWSAVWTKVRSDLQKAPYMLEMDLIEIMGYDTKIEQNLHKWKGNSDTGANSGVFNFVNAATAREFHIYAFEWTPDKLTTLVDGKPVISYDIKADPIGLDNSGFSDPAYLIFENWLYTPGCTWAGHPASANAKPGDFPITSVYDYVRIYQKPGVGKLIAPELTKTQYEDDFNNW